MGTLVKITLYTTDEQAATKAFRSAFDRIGELDRILSDYKADSELNRIATTAVDQAVHVSDDLFTVLAASHQLAVATGGAFDVTQGPVIRLWREARRTSRLPDAAALKEAASRSGYRKLHLDVVNHMQLRAFKHRPRVDVRHDTHHGVPLSLAEKPETLANR